MLTNPYYKGQVTFRGATYDGIHEPLVPKEVWYLRPGYPKGRSSPLREKAGPTVHFPKGSIFCGECGSRLILSNAKNRHGNVYCYFVCSGRHSKRTDCTRQAMLIEDVEKLVEDYYRRIQIAPHRRSAPRTHHHRP